MGSFAGYFLILAFAFACPAFAQNVAVFINGGGGPTQNFSVHEDDILSFQSFLFGGRAKIFNAGGDGGPVAEVVGGAARRDATGQLLLGRSDLKQRFRSVYSLAPEPKGFDGVESATPQNLQTYFQGLRRPDIKTATVVYGDHGGPNGVCLWGDPSPTLDAKGIQGLTDNFPPSTVVRSLHLHCFGGVALVSPGRARPSNMEELHRFVSTHYKMNRCGLALSKEDEAGQYPGWGKDWARAEHPWTSFFATSKNPSLNDVKHHFIQGDWAFPSPVSTSDYLLEDLHGFICRGFAKKKPSLQSRGVSACLRREDDQAPLALSRDVARIASRILEPVCGEETPDEKNLDAIEKELEEIRAASNEIIRLKQEVELDQIHSQIPHVITKISDLRKHQDANSILIDALDRGLSPPPSGDGKASPLTLEAVAADQQKTFVELSAQERLYQAEVNRLKRHNFALDARVYDKQWLLRNEPKYPALSRFMKGFGHASIPDEGTIKQKEFALQKWRKELLARIRKERQETVESWLTRPELGSIRDIYENIKNCEKTPIN